MSSRPPRFQDSRRPKTIAEVIGALEAVVAWCYEEDLRHGYFAQVYLATTKEVARGLEAGEFVDGERLEELDVVFACRYLDALDAYAYGYECSSSWRCAFDADRRGDMLILQHILLGMNAHINLDLGVAAAEVAPGAAIGGIETDFNRINQLLARLVDRVEDALGSTNPLFALGDRLIGGIDEAMIKFSIEAARKHAWRSALVLAACAEGDALDRQVATFDSKVCGFARLVTDDHLTKFFAPLRALDRRSPKDVIALLRTI